MNTGSATARGLNPFTPSEIGAAKAVAGPQGSLRDVYDGRAKGIDGDLLDAMLKGRWQEGYSTGYDDGHAAARKSYQQIFDDGFSSGLGAGANEAATELASRLLPVLQNAGAAFADIAGKTGSEEIKALANDRLSAIREVLDQEVGQHTEDRQRAREEELGGQPINAE